MQADESLRVIPVIVVSAGDAELTLSRQARHVRLTKPVRAEHLLDAVKRVLDAREALVR